MPSHFWMPQVGEGVPCYAIIFRRPALFNFAYSFLTQAPFYKTLIEGGVLSKIAALLQ